VIGSWSNESTLNCVILGHNTSDTCAVISEAYGGEATKKSSVSEWHKLFKNCRDNVEDVEITNEDNARHFLRYHGIVHFQFFPQGQLTKLIP
jgi:hypothetical protein